jgi:hypothetical protein
MFMFVSLTFQSADDALARQVLEFKIPVNLPFISVQDLQPATLQPKTTRAMTTPYANASLLVIPPSKRPMHGVLGRGLVGDKIRVGAYEEY